MLQKDNQNCDINIYLLRIINNHKPNEVVILNQWMRPVNENLLSTYSSSIMVQLFIVYVLDDQFGMIPYNYNIHTNSHIYVKNY